MAPDQHPLPARSSSSSSARRAILILPLPTLAALAHPAALLPPLAEVSRRPLSSLLVILLSPLFAPFPSGLHVRQHWPALQRLLAVVYVEATREALLAGDWEREVEVLLEPDLGGGLEQRVGAGWDVLFTSEGAALTLPEGSPLASLPRETVPRPTLSAPPPTPPSPAPAPPPLPSQHSTTALGGTFDHLHSGHRILLSSALLLTSHKLIVGLTAPPLLKSKRHAALVQGLEERARAVRAFCARFSAAVTVDVVEISDVAGPTAWDGAIDALIVSRETVSGAEAIAKIREANGLPPLEVYVIDVISADDASLPHEDAERLKDAKISSTAIRGWIAEREKERRAREAPAEETPV